MQTDSAPTPNILARFRTAIYRINVLVLTKRFTVRKKPPALFVLTYIFFFVFLFSSVSRLIRCIFCSDQQAVCMCSLLSIKYSVFCYPLCSFTIYGNNSFESVLLELGNECVCVDESEWVVYHGMLKTFAQTQYRTMDNHQLWAALQLHTYTSQWITDGWQNVFNIASLSLSIYLSLFIPHRRRFFPFYPENTLILFPSAPLSFSQYTINSCQSIREEYIASFIGSIGERKNANRQKRTHRQLNG